METYHEKKLHLIWTMRIFEIIAVQVEVVKFRSYCSKKNEEKQQPRDSGPHYGGYRRSMLLINENTWEILGYLFYKFRSHCLSDELRMILAIFITAGFGI